MELIMVPDDGLVRAGGRLAAALARAHDAMMLSHADFTASAMPPAHVGLIHLADQLPTHLDATRAVESEFGALWGHTGREAWVSASAVGDPQATLDAMGGAIADLQSAARGALEALGPLPEPAKVHGMQLAGLYLDPKLRVPAQTVAGGHFSFTPERMCWERQYTLGIVRFLARGFDGWAAGISG